jgi:hypothetical protein
MGQWTSRTPAGRERRTDARLVSCSPVIDQLALDPLIGDGLVPRALDLADVARPPTDAARARLEWLPEHERWRVSCFGAGLAVDGVPTSSAFLRPGCVVRLGDTLMTYVEGEAPSIVHEAPMLVAGPEGVGKSALVRALFGAGGAPVVEVDCRTLGAESGPLRLFGDARARGGAAWDVGTAFGRTGAFVEAEGGVLVLDHVEALPQALQTTVVQVARARRVTPVGAQLSVPFEAGLVATTTADLPMLRRMGRFRAELLELLSANLVTLRGLAERRDEILATFYGFLGRDARPLAPDVSEALLLHDWPGNLRELRAVAVSVGVRTRGRGHVGLDDMPGGIRRVSTSTPPVRPSSPPPPLPASVHVSPSAPPPLGAQYAPERTPSLSIDVRYVHVEAEGSLLERRPQNEPDAEHAPRSRPGVGLR